MAPRVSKRSRSCAVDRCDHVQCTGVIMRFRLRIECARNSARLRMHIPCAHSDRSTSEIVLHPVDIITCSTLVALFSRRVLIHTVHSRGLLRFQFSLSPQPITRAQAVDCRRRESIHSGHAQKDTSRWRYQQDARPR